MFYAKVHFIFKISCLFKSYVRFLSLKREKNDCYIFDAHIKSLELLLSVMFLYSIIIILRENDERNVITLVSLSFSTCTFVFRLSLRR